MSDNKNKVKYGISQVYIAIKHTDDEGNVTYDAPFHLPGAVSWSMSPNGDTTNFYADNIVYYVTSSNAGYEGDLTVAMVTDEFRQKILKEELDKTGVLVEDASAESEEFALMLQVEGNKQPVRIVYYNCHASRVEDAANTKEDKTEPETDKITITCSSLPDGTIRAKTTADTDKATYDAWFSGVYMPNR